jgi:hypothetical protein
VYYIIIVKIVKHSKIGLSCNKYENIMVNKRGGPASKQDTYIDRESSEPVYLQLVNNLRQKILVGEYPPGEKLPSEAMLVEMYQVSPMTVRRAINTLSSGVKKRA